MVKNVLLNAFLVSIDVSAIGWLLSTIKWGATLLGSLGFYSRLREWVFWVLAILGVIIGLLNVTQAETQGFLLAAIGFLLSATAFNLIPIVGETFANPGVCVSLCRWSDDRGRTDSTVRDRP